MLDARSLSPVFDGPCETGVGSAERGGSAAQGDAEGEPDDNPSRHQGRPMIQSGPIRAVARTAAKACWTVAVVATGVAFAYRAYLARASSRMAATGAGEEALFAITIDPLWRVELGIAKLFGNPGTLSMMNALGTVAWGSVFLLSILVANRLRAPPARDLPSMPGGRRTRG